MKTLNLALTALLALALFASAWFGLSVAAGLFRAAHGLGTWAATITEVTYGVTAVLALVLLARRHPRAWPVLVVWAVAVTLTTILAPVAWGDATWAVGAESGAAVAVPLAALLAGWRVVRSRLGGHAPGAPPAREPAVPLDAGTGTSR